jgi:hypothetical protein
VEEAEGSGEAEDAIAPFLHAEGSGQEELITTRTCERRVSCCNIKKLIKPRVHVKKKRERKKDR